MTKQMVHMRRFRVVEWRQVQREVHVLAADEAEAVRKAMECGAWREVWSSADHHSAEPADAEDCVAVEIAPHRAGRST